jgi:hypothetical protein
MKNCRMTKVAKTEGAPKIGTSTSGQCVLIIPTTGTSEQGHDGHFGRDQQAEQHDDEQRVGAREADAREGVARHRREQHRPRVTRAAM